MPTSTAEFTTLTFKGPRFDDHGMDLAVASELVTYRNILIETAKELWRAKNPGRERLPKGFESQLVLRFYKIQEGSVALPILRVLNCPGGEIPLEFEDVFAESAEIIDTAMACAGDNVPPPDSLPAAVIPFFNLLGKSLEQNEWLEFKSPAVPQPIRWDAVSRGRIESWTPRTYCDTISICGEVTQADVEGYSFTLKLSSGDKITGKFSPDNESLVTQALQEHQTVRLRVAGRAEYLHSTGKPRRFLDTPTVALVWPEDDTFDPNESTIWELIQGLTANIPDSELDKLPVDGALNHDRYLTGRS